MNDFFSPEETFTKERLSGDGGHRLYTRIHLKKTTFMLMSCGKQDASLKQFIKIQNRLKAHVFVPKIFHHDLNQGFLLLEDLGNSHLESVFLTQDKAKSLSLYYQAVQQLILIQDQVKTEVTDLKFDKDFFTKENHQAQFRLHKYINMFCSKKHISDVSCRAFKKDMTHIVSHFKITDQVFCHRDYHSRNLMIQKNKPVIIDFQDAGLGPWYYDLTSLLYDSYTLLDSQNKNHLCKFYFESLPKNLKQKVMSLNHLEWMLKMQFLQRGFKACGCFAAFKIYNNKDSHVKYILSSFKLLKDVALELNYQGFAKYIQELQDALQS